jgi:hypothetical protein
MVYILSSLACCPYFPTTMSDRVMCEGKEGGSRGIEKSRIGGVGKSGGGAEESGGSLTEGGGYKAEA